MFFAVVVCFNTSHVSINRITDGDFISFAGVSIHLMFLLITQRGHRGNNRTGVSIHLMFLLIMKQQRKKQLVHSFNTSHVSINLRGDIVHAANILFQYISCFY